MTSIGKLLKIAQEQADVVKTEYDNYGRTVFISNSFIDYMVC